MPVPNGRPVDPAVEADRLAKERAHGPAKVLHIGDAVRVYGEDGAVFTGHIEHVGPFDAAKNYLFVVACAPAEDGTDG